MANAVPKVCLLSSSSSSSSYSMDVGFEDDYLLQSLASAFCLLYFLDLHRALGKFLRGDFPGLSAGKCNLDIDVARRLIDARLALSLVEGCQSAQRDESALAHPVARTILPQA